MPQSSKVVATRSASDSAAFSRAFDAYRTELRAYAMRLVKTREAAEDVVQNAFIRVWNRWTEIDLTMNLRGYLYRATRTSALNHLRDEQAVQRRAAQYDGPSVVEPLDDDATLRSEEIARAVGLVLERMPPRRREVASLRLRHHLSNATIADKLGISEKGVEIHITRAIRTLREQLPALLGHRKPTI
jgi:RNA polymerase sigma-70 factor (ECF subfamily)